MGDDISFSLEGASASLSALTLDASTDAAGRMNASLDPVTDSLAGSFTSVVSRAPQLCTSKDAHSSDAWGRLRSRVVLG